MNLKGYSFIRKTVMLLLPAVIAASCIKETFDPGNFDPALSLTPGLALPVGFSHLTMENYLSDTLFNGVLGIGSDGIITLFFSAPVDSGVMGDLLQIRNSAASMSMINQTGSVISLSAPGESLDISDSTDIPLATSVTDISIDSVHLLSGTLQFNSVFTGLAGTITYDIPDLKRSGVPFTVTRNLSAPAFSLDISGYILTPKHNTAGDNLLTLHISVHLIAPGGPLNPGEAIMAVSASLSSVVYEIIFGDFEGFNIDFPATNISTTFFSRVEEADMRFADPEFRLSFSNSAGVPLGIWFSEIYAVDRNQVHHPLTGSGIPSASDPKIIAWPSLSQAGQSVNDSLVINAANSNLPDIIAVNPDSFTMMGSGTVAPLPSHGTSFIRSDSRYSVSAVFGLPFHGRAELLVIVDTIPFNYTGPELPSAEELESVIVRTSIINSFPADVWPQIYFLDGSYQVIDSLFTGTEKIDGATDNNGDGKADPNRQSPLDVLLPRSKIDNLLNTSYLRVKARISTTRFPNTDVKVYPSSFIDLRIGVIAKLKLDTGDL